MGCPPLHMELSPPVYCCLSGGPYAAHHVLFAQLQLAAAARLGLSSCTYCEAAYQEMCKEDNVPELDLSEPEGIPQQCQGRAVTAQERGLGMHHLTVSAFPFCFGYPLYIVIVAVVAFFYL